MVKNMDSEARLPGFDSASTTYSLCDLAQVTYLLWTSVPFIYARRKIGTSLVVQWLRLHAFTAEGLGSIPDRGAKILHAVQGSQKKKRERENNNSTYYRSCEK